MKNTRIPSAILILASLALHFMSAPARADEQTREEAIALLTSGIWHFAGKDWYNDRVFEAKGTVLVRAGNARGVIKWKMDDKQVTIHFADHDDILYLPIDPKGTKGMDQHGDDIVATLVPGSSNGDAGPPSALSALNAPMSSMDASQSQDAVATLLTSKKWRFEGANWSEVRNFDSSGNMTIDGDTRTARWQVSGNKIVMTFKNHKDILFLPLDPKGTKGQDEYGRLFIAAVDTGTAPTTGAPPVSSGPSSTAPGPDTTFFGTRTGNGDAPATTPAPPNQ